MCNIDGLVQERRNSIALAMELRLSCTNPSDMIYPFIIDWKVNMVVADGLVPIWHQDICNHHVDIDGRDI